MEVRPPSYGLQIYSSLTRGSCACGILAPMATITISRKLAPKDDLVIIPKKEFDALVARARDTVTEQNVLQWSRDAKKMYRTGKLAKLS